MLAFVLLLPLASATAIVQTDLIDLADLVDLVDLVDLQPLQDIKTIQEPNCPRRTLRECDFCSSGEPFWPSN